MNLDNRNWLPMWPVVPLRLWLTGAAGVVAGLSVYFQQEIWLHHPKAALWSWVVLGALAQAGGIQLLRVLRAWLRSYRGPRMVRLLMWCGAVPAYLVLSLLLFGICLLTCYGFVSAIAG